MSQGHLDEVDEAGRTLPSRLEGKHALPTAWFWTPGPRTTGEYVPVGSAARPGLRSSETEQAP